MDYDEVANLSNLTFNRDVTSDESMKLITQEVIFTIFVVIGIMADSAIMFTIFCFKRIHTVPNIFLANWAMADICSLIVTPSSYRIISIIDNTALSQEFLCVLFQGDLVFHDTAIKFMIIIALDWCISVYFPRTSDKFRRVYKVIIGALWVFALLIASGLIRLCIKRIYYQLPAFLILIDYSILLFFISWLHISRIVRKCKKNPISYPTLMLSLATVYTIYWFLGFQMFFFISYEAAHPAVGIIVECCIFCSSIFNFWLLFRFDKDFQACFLQIWKRPEYRYADAMSDFENMKKNSHDKTNISVENVDQNITINTL